MFIKLVMPTNNFISCLPLCLLPLNFPSIRVFSIESVLPIRWPKYWRFSFSICHLKEYLGLISFRMYWLDLLAFQGTLKSLVQNHSSKASVLWYTAFFMVQLTPLPTSGKTIALTLQTSTCKRITPLFSMFSRFFIAFFFQGASVPFFTAAGTICSDFGSQENKVPHCFHCFSMYLP